MIQTEFQINVFPTVEEAIEWLRVGAFRPVFRENVPGLWTDGRRTMQAFRNCSGTWSVNEYTAPNPANFITE